MKKIYINWNLVFLIMFCSANVKADVIFKRDINLSFNNKTNISLFELRKNRKEMIRSAKKVLKRVLGEKSNSISLAIISAEDGIDTYEYEAKKGRLYIRGSSVVALTRGVYDYLRDNHLGEMDWTGPKFRLPKYWPDADLKRLTSPFRIRQAYNVVTSGYTTPYWDWERWEQELDWQTMHGFNMLMAPVATEAIASRVWKRLGLTQPEIDEFYVGPAHLPWQRMGNISQVGGTLPPEWHVDQINLQHKLLKRMRELGIDPIVQSFAGFVPKALKRIYPDIELYNTLWNGGFAKNQRPVLMMPNNPVFTKITKMYMEEWQKEFGEADYYLVDSFNELELPETDTPVTELLADYGKKTYNAIIAGDKNATWVIQGWMFGYQRHIWSPERVQALFSKVPNDRVLILDYANDYANNWEPMNGFNGKQWAYGFVPNMGGKTIYTGDINLYATGASKVLKSPKKGNLVGYSISGEGLENNTVLYELMADAAWSEFPINLKLWLANYNKNRYGFNSEKLMKSWDLLIKSTHNNLIPHPTFGWQKGQYNIGETGIDHSFVEATKLFLSESNMLSKSESYEADVIERVALSLGFIAEKWFDLAAKAYRLENIDVGDKAGKRALELLKELDRLLESHPLNRLDRWLNFAKSHSDDPQLQKFYESNARQIITTWGPPVNDYSCRLWSGLVRDFYLIRMKWVLKSLKTGVKFEKKSWEINWVESVGISEIEPFNDPLEAAKILFKKAVEEQIPLLKNDKGIYIGEWSSAIINEEWKSVEWSLTSEQLKRLKGITFLYLKGENRLDIKSVSLIADGKVVSRDNHIGFAGKPSHKRNYLFQIPKKVLGNNGCSIRAIVKSNGGIDSRGVLKLILK